MHLVEIFLDSSLGEDCGTLHKNIKMDLVQTNSLAQRDFYHVRLPTWKQAVKSSENSLLDWLSYKMKNLICFAWNARKKSLRNVCHWTLKSVIFFVLFQLCKNRNF